MKFSPTELPEVILIEPDVHGDARGFFLEAYHREKYQAGGIGADFVQDNHSRSNHGILRGLHSQRQHPQGKLVRVVEGEVYDVAVDIRVGSPYFGRFTGSTLSAENFRQMYVPPGFAHGFVVLSESAQFEYKCTEFYDPSDEITIAWNDPAIAIPWPIEQPIVSEKDAAGRLLSDYSEGELPRYSSGSSGRR